MKETWRNVLGQFDRATDTFNNIIVSEEHHRKLYLELAENIAMWLMNSLGFAVAPSSILVRIVIEKWFTKEILGSVEG